MAAVSEVIGRPLIVAQTPVKEMTSQLQFPRATPSLTLADVSEELDRETEQNSEAQYMVHKSYLDVEYESPWQPARVHRIRNNTLDTEYEEKKKELMLNGRKEEELEECYGFIVENNITELQALVVNGIQAQEGTYNPLGYSRLGVYVCRHADICLQQAISQHPGSEVIRMLVCKYMLGRSTTAIPRGSTATEFIEPTQGYDAHQCALIPQEGVPVQTQFDRSQVYLYEIDKLLRPSTRPRHVVPYAIVTYTVHGVHHAELDSKPTGPVPPPLLTQTGTTVTGNESDSSGSPRQILMSGVGTGKPDAFGGATGAAAGLLKVATDGPSLSPALTGGMLPGMSGVSNAVLPGAANVSTSGLLDRRLSNGSNVFAGAASGSTGADGIEKSPQVQAIVNQINARLEAQEKTKLAMNVGALTGSSIMTGSASPGDRSNPVANGLVSNASAYFSQSTPSQSSVLANMVTDNSASGSVMPKLATMPHGGLGGAAALGTAGGLGSSASYPDPAALAFRGLSPLSYIPGTSMAMAASQRPTLTQCNGMQPNGMHNTLSGLHKPNGMDYAQLAAAVAAANGAAAGNYYSPFQHSAATHGVCNPMDTLSALGLGNQSAGTHPSLAQAAAGYHGLSAMPGGLPGGIPGGLAALQQTAMGFNRNNTNTASLKRPYSDGGAAVVDFDKRPKLF